MKRLNWYILLVRTGFEQQIKEQLVLRKLEFKIDEVALSCEFPGYIFIKSKFKDNNTYNFLEIENTIKLLGKKTCIVNGKRMIQPEMFSSEQIEKLSLVKDQQTKKIAITVGDNVIVKKGDLVDIQGRVVEIKKRIIKIQPDLFQKIIKVSIQDVECI
jgi:transcription antitermination factor NusG